MATLKTNLIEPSTGTTLTVGESGGDLVIGADSINNNVLKDAGGNAIWTSNGSGVLSGVNSAFGSAQVLIQTQVASSSATISFTSGIDSTYKEYVFEIINIHPATNGVDFTFQAGSSYDETITSSSFLAWTGESSGGALGYLAGGDQAQGTAFQHLMQDVGNGADESGCGELHLFNPASTTYVKNFYGIGHCYEKDNQSFSTPTAGYFNTTSAITQVQFKMSSGNIDVGTIKMYGIK